MRSRHVHAPVDHIPSDAELRHRRGPAEEEERAPDGEFRGAADAADSLHRLLHRKAFPRRRGNALPLRFARMRRAAVRRRLTLRSRSGAAPGKTVSGRSPSFSRTPVSTPVTAMKTRMTSNAAAWNHSRSFRSVASGDGRFWSLGAGDAGPGR